MHSPLLHSTSHTRRVEDILGLREDLINLLQGAALGLGEEEVNAGHDGCVDNSEDDVVSASDRGETDRSHLSQQEVECPDGGGGNGADSGTDLERCHFSGVEERQTGVADCEDKLEAV